MSRELKQDRRGAARFLGGLALVLAALGALSLARRAPSPAAPAASLAPPLAPGSILLGPRDPNEPEPSAVFSPSGRRSGFEKSFYVFGTVENRSPFAIDKPMVRVLLLDSSGQRVGASEGYAERERLEPREVSPVKVLVSDPPDHVALGYEVVARRALFDPGRVSGLEVELDGPPKQNFNTWEVTGALRNRGKVAARLPRVELVAKDAEGRILGVESAYPESGLLEPESASRFRANLMLDQKPENIVPSAFARPAR